MLKFRTTLRSTQTLIDLTPLVDVVFLMLIFFIITSDILPLKSLNIQNPSLNKDSAPLTTQLVVVMDAQHVIYLGSKKKIVDMISLKEALMEELQRMKEQNPENEPAVVLSVDKRIDYGAFLRLFSICQECHPKLRLVYQPAEESL